MSINNPKNKTVASISFQDNHSLSMDVEEVNRIDLGVPVEVADGVWCSEVLIRSEHGNVSLNILADDPDKLRLRSAEPEADLI